MWNVDIYSIGDTYSNDFLRLYETTFTGAKSLDKFTAKFTHIHDIDERIWELKHVLERAKNELDLLEKHHDKLVGCTDWQQVLEK